MSDEDVVEDTVEDYIQEHKNYDNVAYEVLAGHWGRGSQRTKRLTDAGYDAKRVYQQIDKILHQ